MTLHDSAPTTYSLSAPTKSKDKLTCKSPGASDPDVPKSKPEYWRSLSQLRGKEQFASDYLNREFPVAASEFPEGVSRRRWMKLMGASLAMVGAAGCRYPEEEILPFVIRPEGRIPGESYLRATNFELAGRVYNLLVSNFDGRPLKIEPNNEHPSGGGTDVFSQASILGLYDPDRARGDGPSLLRKGPERRGQVGWDEFDAFGRGLVKAYKGAGQGAKLAVLMSGTHSPSTARLLGELKKQLPKATFASYDSVDAGVMRVATTKVFGKPATQVLDLEQADVVVTLQADILGNDRGMIGTAKGYAKRRDPINGEMNRLYAVEGNFTITGASSDTRLALQPSQMPAFLAELGRVVESLKSDSHDHSDETVAFDELDAGARLERFLDQLAHDIVEAGDKAVVVVGEALGADMVAAGIAMNKKLGSLGKAQKFVAAADAELGELVSLADLTAKIGAGDIESLLILGDNPVFTAPGDVDVAAAISKVEHSIYLGEYDDETGAICEWSLPLAHPLEAWGDVVDSAGNYGVCQPQILPLLGGRSVIEVLAAMMDLPEVRGEQIVRRTADSIGSALSDREWAKLLHDGFADGLVVKSGDLSASDVSVDLPGDAPAAIDDVDKDQLEVLFVPADGIYDGRFANNGWLQEMPHALTKMCWDNAAVMSPKTATKLGVKHGLFVALEVGDSKVQLPVYEMPGFAPGVVSVPMGYGRTRVGEVGGDAEKGVPIVGIDVSPLRRSDAMLLATSVKGRPRYEDYDIATTQDHWAIDEGGRNETIARSFSLVREGTVELLKKVPEFAESLGPHVPKVGREGSLWNEPMATIQEDPAKEFLPQWGMAIDLSKCTGCNACVIACQSENNVPIVGREQVLNSREMHWLRIDRYFRGDEDFADVVQEPVACMHCETAPCEQVCPVAATVHTDEGLNAMAYNRCIGTRYCANNCPFKVRRFNYFNYNTEVGVGYGVDAYPGNIESANRKLQALVMNPEVTVRGRGVMEKCTYCVQRIEKGKITARKEDRRVGEGDVVTACQAACPTNAIEFGDISDPESAVSKKRQDVRSYGMLEQLNVKPRTEYLARVRNTPARLMTTRQITDLAELKAPHHGHDDHGDGGHGDDSHGHGEHDDHGHGHDDHGHDEAHAEKDHA
ncbi:TAT-variant-translocated molybdopterin oxidoreductase [Rubripirellula amarantea]|uniref:Tetrathionate reductase subunit B n=1 Tax=Rubripirellula amarantea TaxID=2527999 RepID=A0A5C5WTS0_9BACT|nr:TAT-variant-translocated molybdopterin oxidoreductase [Rubripirellula amarantea]MDA8745058.1 TAT-variant-translocated molybdopterin oxidoreductase [Rubripirellula amarantea]TWT53958.1 Tetrathionate reductase subunit B precursor [Rubripirellula amarantea]